MSVRVPGKSAYAVYDIKYKSGGTLRQLTALKARFNGVVYTFWQEGMTTFFDKYGNILVDVNGVPFQGKAKDTNG